MWVYTILNNNLKRKYYYEIYTGINKPRSPIFKDIIEPRTLAYCLFVLATNLGATDQCTANRTLVTYGELFFGLDKLSGQAL